MQGDVTARKKETDYKKNDVCTDCQKRTEMDLLCMVAKGDRKRLE